MGHTHSILCKSCMLHPAVFRVVHDENIEPCLCDIRECQCRPRATIVSMTLFESTTPRRWAEPCSRCGGRSHMISREKCTCSYAIRVSVMKDEVTRRFKEIAVFATNQYHYRRTNIYSFQFFACSTCAATNHEWMSQPTLEYNARGFTGHSF